MHTQQPVACARGVSKYYGDVVALDRVDLDVAPGEIHGLIGPNGAGKSTLLGLLLGLSVPDDGRLEVLGVPLRRGAVMPNGVSGFVDEPGLYPSLTPRQNLAALASLRGDDTADVGWALARVGLTDVADDRVRGFSLGMRQRLGLASALLTRPRLLVLDEPTNGLDPAARRQVHRVVEDVAAAGTAVVLTSHRMDDLAELCTEVTILSTGRVVFAGPVEELAAEAGELDHRIRTTDGAAARAIAVEVPGLRVVAETDAPPRRVADTLLVRGSVERIEELLARLVTAGVPVRELGPVVPPLEAAFLALTADADSGVRVTPRTPVQVGA